MRGTPSVCSLLFFTLFFIELLVGIAGDGSGPSYNHMLHPFSPSPAATCGACLRPLKGIMRHSVICKKCGDVCANVCDDDDDDDDDGDDIYTQLIIGFKKESSILNMFMDLYPSLLGVVWCSMRNARRPLFVQRLL